MDAYSPTSQPDPGERAWLPMVQYARFVLAFVAIWNAATALFMAVGFPVVVMQDDEAEFGLVGAVVAGVIMGLIYAALSVTPYAAAFVGLRRGARWGAILTVALGVWGLGSCLPIGAFLLYAMLNRDVREAFFA